MNLQVSAGVLYAVVVVGSIAVAVCIWFVLRSVRRLNRRLAEFREELEARQGAPMDPFAALAEVYAENARRDAEKKRGKR